MDKCFCLGVAFGLMAGALLAANSRKVRNFVCESQKKVQDGVEKALDDEEKRKKNKE